MKPHWGCWKTTFFSKGHSGGFHLKADRRVPPCYTYRRNNWNMIQGKSCAVQVCLVLPSNFAASFTTQAVNTSKKTQELHVPPCLRMIHLRSDYPCIRLRLTGHVNGQGVPSLGLVERDKGRPKHNITLWRLHIPFHSCAVTRKEDRSTMEPFYMPPLSFFDSWVMGGNTFPWSLSAPLLEV